MAASIFGCTQPASTITPAEKPITLVFTTHEPLTGLYQSDFFEPWIAELEKRTQGRIKVEAHYDGELASPIDAYDAVRTGVVDMAQLVTQWVPEQFPMDSVLALPSYDKVIYRPSRALWELYKKFPEFQAEYKDVKLLSLAATYYTCPATSQKPIRKLEDNEGLTMITTGRWPAVRGETLGWTTVSVLPGDVYSAIEKGVVDGGLLGTTYSMIDFKWVEPLHYITRVPVCSVTIAIMMNLDTWNNLPPGIQKTVDEMTPWMVALEDEWRLRRDGEFRETFSKDYGTEFIDLSPEELARWNEVDKSVREMFVAELEAKGLPGKELMDEFLRLEEKYSAPEYAYK